MMNKTKTVFILAAIITVVVLWMAYDRYKEKAALKTPATT